jgi:hypothetical protein
MDRRRFASAVLSLAVVVGSLVACTWWLSSLSHRDDTVLAAASPSAEASAEPSADPSPSASLDGPPGSPVDAVAAFYDHLNAKDYQGAYALLSSAEQQRHPFAAFSAYQSRIDATAFKITGSRLDTVALIVGEHHIDDPRNVQETSGTWHLVESSDRRSWLLDTGVFSSPTILPVATSPPGAVLPIEASPSPSP